MISISGTLLIVVLLVALAIFIYKLIYTQKINKRIQSGEITGRKLIDVSKMVMIAIMVGLAVYCGLLMCVVHNYQHQDHSVSRNNFAGIDVSDVNNYKYVSYLGDEWLEDASYAKVYKKDANEGYSKEVVESGEYLFTVFTRTAPADSFHPDFLCFVEYVGTNKDKYTCYTDIGYQAIAEDGGYYSGGSAGDISESLLYIGYLEKDCEFHITLSLLDETAEMEFNEAMQQGYKEDKGQFPKTEEYAVSTGSVSIRIDE